MTDQPNRRSFLRMGVAAGAAVLSRPALALTSLNAPALLCSPVLGADGRRLTEDEQRIVSEGVRHYGQQQPQKPIITQHGARRLRLGRNRFGETFDAIYYANGRYVQSALDEFKFYCRDGYHKVHEMDPKVLDLVNRLGELLDLSKPLNVNSGYRSPAYNRAQGGERGSLHLSGKALDVWTDGASPLQVQKAAESLRAGGVGRYRAFTHIDTGRVRYWRG